MENYPGYLEFMANHFPVKQDSDDAYAEFLVTVLPEVKTVYDADAYAAVIKKHLPEKVEPEQLTAFAKSFFDFHFQRIRDRRNERIVILYRVTAILLLIQLVVFSGLILFPLLYVLLLITLPVLIILALSVIYALRKSKYEPLQPADHIAFAANLLFNFIMVCWIIGFVF
jgi:hypothetical protein